MKRKGFFKKLYGYLNSLIHKFRAILRNFFDNYIMMPEVFTEN